MTKTAKRWIRSAADEHAVKSGCWFCEKTADHVVRFFRQYLRHSKGRWAGKPFELLDWQRVDIVYPLFGWLREDGSRRYRKAYVELPKKNGKALALNTPIPTPEGWRAMGDLEVGDEVFDENGLPSKIVAVTEPMIGRPCLMVTFGDGERIVADADHEWRVFSTNKQRCLTVPTFELAGKSDYSIAVSAPLQCARAQLPIEPYLLGCWIGDGHSDSARLTIGEEDRELVDHIVSAGTAIHSRGKLLYQLGSAGRSQYQRNHSIAARLRRLGLIGSKRIPRCYLRAAHSQRLAVLQGLMDTDGFVSKKGQCELTTVSPDICNGALELIRSLGLKPSLTTGRAMLKGKDCGVKYRIQFWAFKDTPVFRLSRKLARQLDRQQRQFGRLRSESRKIVSAEYVESVPVRCIQVDSPSRLFLAGRAMIPTHNSTLASGIGLYMLVGDGEGGAEVYSAAADRAQASIVHGEAINMVNASPELLSVLSVNHTTKTISFGDTMSVYKAITGDAGPNEGLKASCVICDELHIWRGRGLWEALLYAGRTRKHPLTFVITTAGSDPLSVCREQHDYANSVLNGTHFDDRYFAYIRAADETQDLHSKKVQAQANPSLGITIDPEEFNADLAEAEKSPTAMAAFKRYSFNIWTAAENPGLRMEDWLACGEDFYEDDLKGQRCYAGLDLSKTRDMTALVLAFREDKTRCRFLPYFWLPEDVINDHLHPYHAYLRQWHRDGYLFATPGNTLDYEFVRAKIAELAKKFRIVEMAYDPWNADETSMQIEKDCGIRRIEFKQTITNFAGPTKELENLVISGGAVHNRHPVLTWQAGHVQWRHDVNANIQPVKPPTNDKRKIDGIVAAIMALARAMANQDKSSVYNRRPSLLSV